MAITAMSTRRSGESLTCPCLVPGGGQEGPHQLRAELSSDANLEGRQAEEVNRQKNASPAPAPAEPQPGPSGRGHGRDRGGRKRGRGRAPANATATVACSHPGTSSVGGDGAERGAAVAPTGSIIPGPTWDSGSVEPKKPKDEKTTAKGENDKVDGEKKEVKAEEDKSESDVRPD